MGFTDWQVFVKDELSKGEKPKLLVELGLGEGTPFLLSLAEKVVSIELLFYPEHAEWIDKTKNMIGENENWRSYMKEVKEDKLTTDIVSYLNLQLGRLKPDVVFIDPGVHFRGDLVNLAMKREVPIIFAHDTLRGFDEKDIYGWNRITGEGYERTDYREGEGTSLWERIK